MVARADRRLPSLGNHAMVQLPRYEFPISLKTILEQRLSTESLHKLLVVSERIESSPSLSTNPKTPLSARLECVTVYSS